MKKRLVSICMILVMIFALTGCAGNKEEKEDSKKVTSEQETKEKETEKETETEKKDSEKWELTNEGEYSSLEDYYKKNKEVYETSAKNINEQQKDINYTVAVDGNVMTKTTQHTKPLSTSNEEEAKRLEELFKDPDICDLYQKEVDMLAWECGIDDIVLCYETLDCDGNLIYSKEFVAQDGGFSITVEMVPGGESAETETKTEAETEKETESKKASSQGKYENLEEWGAENSALLDIVIDEVNKSVESEGVSFDLYTEGNTLVYSYVYEEALDVSDPAIQQTVNDYFDSYVAENASTFDDLRVSLADMAELDADDVTIRVLWYNPDGSLVYDSEHE